MHLFMSTETRFSLCPRFIILIHEDKLNLRLVMLLVHTGALILNVFSFNVN